MATITQFQPSASQARPAAGSLLTKVSMHDGSVLVVRGAPEAIYREIVNNLVVFQLLGDGVVRCLVSEIYSMVPFRRPQPVSAVAEDRS
jgi:hypothetical protein